MFDNREDAGRKLATALSGIANDAVILAIPRGGVVVGYEISKSLGMPLDITVPRKIGAPGNPELAIGAVGDDGTVILDDDAVRMVGVPSGYIDGEIVNQKLEISRRVSLYRKDRTVRSLEGHTAILVDDGIATGLTMKVAVASARNRGAESAIVAVPVCPTEIGDMGADRVVCLEREVFGSVGELYKSFEQVSDDEVIRLLNI